MAAWMKGAAYAYDGSFDGLLSCVFESYERKEELVDLRADDDPQVKLFESRWVETSPEKASRVYSAIRRSISQDAQELVRRGFLTCEPQKDLLIYRFLRLGFRHGRAVMDMLTETTVHRLRKAVRHLNTESHALMGFVRFSVYGDVLVSVIEPKNRVLPILAPHFSNRYRQEAFLIYDQTHRQALIHRPKEATPDRTGIVDLDELVLPEVGEQERVYRRLWKQFYDTVAIRERLNPRAQMSHMPKRYWAQLTEMRED
ncbi:MAG: TIGR03915 family putative DNA repair protein [Paenibacillaceae bacterium]|uniref:TIGR03915 family putative DNA repair protein n=1 Tax=Paenibacillus mellifer TaxID=2937794 RepID=A0A9X1XV33_9BACL|nr:TIGR03915 family putative DNA repair protein [Paenibacillus mellifer]MBW4838471.1 TIGR03915 family putative DNA repair protein [Paenibacillaceae bacterium]MCK8485894.1 TIGR03915 family putative DNA repair protein [Paenibacillus mellifer]